MCKKNIMKKKKEKSSMKIKIKKWFSNKIEDYKIFGRSVKTTYSLDKRFFWMQIINVASDRIKPFINTYISSIVINGVFSDMPIDVLITYALITVFVNFILNILILITSSRRYIRKSMWEKVMLLFFNKTSLKMDYSNFEDIDVCDRRKRIERNIKQGRGISNYNIWHNLIGALITIFASSTIILSLIFAKNTNSSEKSFIYSPITSIVFIVFLILSYCFSNWFEKTNSELLRKSNEFYVNNWRLTNKMEKYQIDNKLSMEYNIFGLHKIIVNCAENSSQTSMKFEKDFSIRMTKRAILSLFMQILIRFLSISFVVIKAMTGAFGPGSIILYIGTIIQLSNAISSIGYVFGGIHGSRTTLEDEFKYLDIKSNMPTGSCILENATIEHTIEFKNVSFKYPNSEIYCLKNINLKIYPYDRIAIVGQNGSGKSTFVKLLCRLYDPQEGQILLDGKDIKQFDYYEYLKLFSVVFQDFKLFSYTLGENIAISKKYDIIRVQHCIDQVGLSNRVNNLPNGLKTYLYKNFNSDGVEISGGEAQKIAIARALYKDGPFVILDEPTAALDPLSEFDIFSELNKTIEQKTAIYISHRLSSCKFCNKIIVFDEGKLIQMGTHEQLINEDGKYAQLWNAQASVYNNQVN